MIPPEFVQQLLSRLDIVEVVGAHISLKKSGASYKGLCPFHGEKTPSFHVSATRQTYHCFGCGVHGDAIRFLCDHLGLSFIEAVQDLSRRVGLDVPDDRRSAEEREQAQKKKAEQRDLSELLDQAASYYRQQLKTAPAAIEYLKGRGLSGVIAAQFGLGYAPKGWRGLSRCFSDYADAQLEAAGLVIVSEDRKDEDGAPRRYDRFRDRVMFPIRNVAGAVIGFGGRVLDHGEPKYLNSPETPVFIKGQELYGLYEARAAIRRAGYALVVEGYMDVVALAQFGIGQAVATLGTACSVEHVHKLFRFTDQIVFSFDGDAAGRKAAERALTAALPHLTATRQVRFLFLPPEHDPDSFVRAEGREAFERASADAMPLSSFLIEVASHQCRLDTPEGRARFLQQAQSLWSPLPEGGLKQQMAGELAHRAKLSKEELLSQWQGFAAVPERNAPPESPVPGGANPNARETRWLPRKDRKAAPGKLQPLSPPSPEDRLVRAMLVNAAAWAQLSTETHTQLTDRPGPHAAVLAWLDRQTTEHGPLAWAELRARLAEDPECTVWLQQRPALALEHLDEAASLDWPADELQRLVQAVLQSRLDLTAILGRPAAKLRLDT
ncbi:DNA primase [Inhella gelatinilytica]|uniref:DNA primase n=1 Tax=Inhella gelatinilytica TaxID=2795030 RepID=A0A931J0V7_9BURK|nr:DNA primase [Inhella gelatinilytica]MBH9553463.1 DNA primase [Inhella gelatinilytica]